jgi:hypothetical protein
MKRVLHLMLSICFAAAAAADPKADAIGNAKAQRHSADLFKSGNSSQAVATLDANLVTSAKGDDRTIELAQRLLGICVEFYNRRQIRLAKEVASQAAALVEPVRKKGKSGQELADLLNRLGGIFEDVFYDLDAALSYYDAAIAASPGHTPAKENLGALLQKLKTRKAVTGR